MHVIHARNVNNALFYGVSWLLTNGLSEPSRNGPVLVAPCPVTTVYARPEERVLFSDLRNANPFGHLMEALWMLSGRDDVAFPARYMQNLTLYSDDNVRLNGAYGFRWRQHFGYDQLKLVTDDLKANPASRRDVVAMWDAVDDQTRHDPRNANLANYEGDLKRGMGGGKDIPCNTHIYFRLNAGQLDMTVCNRSNDAIWGAYGANAVHFSMLQEYMASMIGCALGKYYQVANNFHIYSDREDARALNGDNVHMLEDDRYATHHTPRTPLVHRAATWDDELQRFMEAPSMRRTWDNQFFDLANAMARAHELYKENRLGDAIGYLQHSNVDWAVAGYEWLKRIAAKRERKGAVA